MNSQTVSILYIVALFAILYFLMIRPPQQRQKRHQEMIKSLRPMIELQQSAESSYNCKVEGGFYYLKDSR